MVSLISMVLVAAMLTITIPAIAGGPNPVGACNVPLWCPVSTPNQSGSNILYGTTALSNTDAWAVGLNNGATASPITQHWDGNTWTSIAPASVLANAQFYSAAAIAPNDVWAVGYDNYSSREIQYTLAQHWDGSSWSTVSSPNVDANAGQGLAGVAAISSNDIWAVGSSNRSGIHHGDGIDFTLAEHWNGTAWSVASSPNINPGTGYNSLLGIAAVSSNNVWAVGFHTNYLYYSTPRPLIEHWDGTSWSISSSLPDPGADSLLDSIAVFSANDIWAVGSNDPFGSPQPLVVHWDGSSWTVADALRQVPGGRLWGVTITPEHEIWAVGTSAAGPLVMHWQGGSINDWVVFPNTYPNVSGGLYSVAAPLAQTRGNTHNPRMWAVGYSTDGNTDYTLADTYAPLIPGGLTRPNAPKLP